MSQKYVKVCRQEIENLKTLIGCVLKFLSISLTRLFSPCTSVFSFIIVLICAPLCSNLNFSSSFFLFLLLLVALYLFYNFNLSRCYFNLSQLKHQSVVLIENDSYKKNSNVQILKQKQFVIYSLVLYLSLSVFAS